MDDRELDARLTLLQQGINEILKILNEDTNEQDEDQNTDYTDENITQKLPKNEPRKYSTIE